jgi:enoyl-[acyl-carrier-protein] reductase (NADH)
MGIFAGKVGLVMGVANERSIAWAMSDQSVGVTCETIHVDCGHSIVGL